MQRVLIGSNMQQYGRLHEARMGIQVFEASLKRLALVPGRYQVSLYLGDGQRDYEVIENAIQFDVAWLGDGNATRPPHVGILHETVEWK
jgi:hypothetical protein